jgi:hypothetical protein
MFPGDAKGYRKPFAMDPRSWRERFRRGRPGEVMAAVQVDASF